MSKYIALIPAYEPEHLMIGLLEELSKTEIEAVVIDDGSGEKFRPLFAEAEK